MAAWWLVAFAIPVIAVGQEFRPEILKAWDDKDVAGFEVPLAQRDRSPRYMSAKEYYALRVRPVYRSYPMYAAGHEPAGYIESLKQKEPEIIFDPVKLHTKEDWIQAGKLVFETDTRYRPAPATAPPPSPTIAADGTFNDLSPFHRYYVRTKGVLEVGINACANCHTRRMPDGSFLEGSQLNFGFVAGTSLREQLTPDELARRREVAWVHFGVPWILSKQAFFESLKVETFVAAASAAGHGVLARQGTSLLYPPHIPSLIGVQDLKYLDATGLVKHRSIGDLMRYAIINEGLDTLAYFGDFQPSPHQTAFSGDEGTRYSDEQLYALALYIYSLKPPANPNSFDQRAQKGQKVFGQQGCSVCHTPPLYTNNKLTPATGFKVPEDLLKGEDVMNVSVGTDPTLALETRRGTGFYKVPSLRGVWYRNAFGHEGRAETLEEWFDPARLNEDYVPMGYHPAPGPIRGHEFGLKLSSEERQALIAFLKSL